LLKEGITHIINVTKNIPFYHENSESIKIEYLRVSVNDSCDQDIKKYFDEANNFIDKVKQQNGKVLVHCQAGISRSPTIVIAYLMNSKNLSLEECYDDVKKIRPIVEPNFLFYSQLHIYESCLNKSLNVQTL
jgi:protein-tyrosine phosphatase